MKKILMVFLIVLVLSLSACTLPERPVEEDPVDPVYATFCIQQDNFTFYQASVEKVLGTEDVYMMVTPDGDVEIPDGIYDAAMQWEYDALCYRTADGVLDKYVSARRATTKPEPIIETVIEEVEVIVIEEVLTHSVIDSDFIAEDGIFYYYIGESIVNLVYKQGLHMYILNLLYDQNIIEDDQAMIASITYFNGVYKGTETIDTDWQDASVVYPDDTITHFTSMEELLTWLIENYSFAEVAADYAALEAGDVAHGFFAEEKAAEDNE